MTFNFDTYPANVLNTPEIITGTSTAFATEDETFFTQNLTTCAFFGTNFDSEHPKIEADSSDNPQYQTQVYYVKDTNTTWKALVGFTWSNTDIYFGVFEFGSGDSSKVIESIKVYRVVDDSVSEIKLNEIVKFDGSSEIKSIKTGVFTKTDGTPLFGYYYNVNGENVTDEFYLPPRSFFLEGKHAPVTTPSYDGNLEVIKSKVYSFKNKA